jgi:putative ABC transport system ATP-binding protein
MIRVCELSSTIPVAGARRVLLDGLNLEVSPGESVAIVGRSGTGKTSLLSILGLMRRPEGGTIELDGRDMTSISESRAARERNQLVGFVFQAYSLIPNLTVFQNVAIPAQYARRPQRETRERVMEVLDSVEMKSFAMSRPTKLSGGEQQRVAIARSLVMRPKVILADEPTGALDLDTGGRVMDLLVETTRSYGSSLVVVTHDRHVANKLDRQYWLSGGRLLEDPGTTAEDPDGSQS